MFAWSSYRGKELGLWFLLQIYIWLRWHAVVYHSPSRKLRHTEVAWGHDRMGTKCILASNKPLSTTFDTYPPPRTYNSAFGHVPQGTTQRATHDRRNKTGRFETQGISIFTLRHSRRVLTTPPTPGQTPIRQDQKSCLAASRWNHDIASLSQFVWFALSQC